MVALNSLCVVAFDFFAESPAGTHGVLGDFYYSYFCLTSLPAVLVGVAAGQWASERIDQMAFKRIVLLMCLGLGVQLLSLS